ncbi:MAG: DMT family transporter [Actinomycetota bacterium]
MTPRVDRPASPVIGAFWGTLAALGIGASDLFGRRIVQRVGPVTAAFVMQVVGAMVAAMAVTVVGGRPTLLDLLWGALSGLGMAIGLGCYFAGLAASSASVVSPIVATLLAVLPYGYALARGGEASGIAVAGAVVAFVGLALVAGGSTAADGIRAGVLWGLVSGTAYGIATGVLVEVTEAAGAWPAVSQRLAAVMALGASAAALRAPAVPPPGLRLNGLGAGVAAGLTSVFLLLGLEADAPPAVVTNSMFPVFTVAVGAAFYGDAVSRRQLVGIAVALIGIAFVVGA